MIQPIQEAFLENSWDEEDAARHQQDQRFAQLQASGLDCKKENLYTVDGRRVFLVTATMPETPALSQPKENKPAAPRPRPQRSPRRIQPFEER